jgi:hypothetical protein
MPRWMAGALIGLGLLGAAASVAIASPALVTVQCSPGSSTCEGWHTQAVSVKWQHSAQHEQGCVNQVVDPDTAGTVLGCTAWNGDKASGYTTVQVTVKVDATPPSVIGVPGRPPDFDGWFNHPVGLSFRGGDATSGVASCSRASYGGPNRSRVQVGGTCTDGAGNVGSGSFPLSYDATRPARPHVTVRPGNRRVTLRWSRLRSEEVAEVSRRRSGSASAVMFSGKSVRFTDRRLRNGRRYRYAVTIRDQAGNRSQTRVVAVPTASRLLLPARGARLRRSPLLVWKASKRASYYNVQLFRGRRKVLSRWPHRAQLQLRRLRRGHYRWYVWPGYGRLSANRYGRMLGGSTFVIR